MSRHIVNEERNTIATYKEVGFIFAVFAVILYLLYPQKMLHKQVLAERSNYALTSIYLENMLRLEPGNADLILATVGVSLQNGNPDLAQNLIETLRKNAKPAVLAKISRYQYEVYKLQKERVTGQKQKAQYAKEMEKVLKETAQNGQFATEDALLWFQDAVAGGYKKEALAFMSSLKIDDPHVLEQCIYLADETSDNAQKETCFQQLTSVSYKGRSKEWLVAIYRVYTQAGDIPGRKAALEELVKLDPGYDIELAQLNALTGSYRDSSQLYMKLYEASGDEESKKRFLLQAIEVLGYNGLKEDAVALMQQHEAAYFGDEEMMNRFISIYLGIGALDAANELSKKLLERGEGK